MDERAARAAGRPLAPSVRDVLGPGLVQMFLAFALAGPPFSIAGGSAPALQGAPSRSVTYRGLELTVIGVERASSAALKDCPPGENTQKGVTKPGEEFAIVTVNFKVLPAFKPGPMARPTARDSAGTTYYTAVSFVDVGKLPEFTCAFPFRVPVGLPLRTLHIGEATLDLAPFATPPDR